MSPKPFSNTSVLITGASRGIGAAIARAFVAAGANVTLLARNERALAELADDLERTREPGRPGGVLAVPGDVGVYADVQRAVTQAVARFGGLDVLVSNAGVIEPIALLAEGDPDAWARAVDVNLKGVYHGLRAALPAMLAGHGSGSGDVPPDDGEPVREGSRGVVVHLSSGAATSALEGWSAYCASKAAVLSLTACAHREYGPRGVRVVGLSPGTVATAMQVTIRASGVNPVSRLDPAVHIPPEWVARAVLHLCGPAGAAYAGTDFSLKTDDGRRQVGLPPVGARPPG